MSYIRLTSTSDLPHRRNLLSSSIMGASALLLHGFLIAPCIAAPVVAKPIPQKAAPLKNPSTDYVLGPEDVLDIRVSNHSELNNTITIRPDGRITLDRAGEVTAAGKTARTLSKEIEDKLALTLNNARVQISVKQARVRQARVLGAVKTPGGYTLQKDTRLVDFVAQAGGLSTKPSRITGRLIRSGNIIPLQVVAAMNQPGSSANIVIQPNDLVELSAPDYTRQLTVSGSVLRSGIYDLDENLTAAGLLGEAGGPTEDASLKDAYVLRDGKRIPLDLIGASNGRSSTTFQFRVGDILFIPKNETRFGILGEVARPNYYMLPERVEEATLLKALAQAGGATADGDLSNITLTRITNGTSVQLPVDALPMLKGDKPDDIVLKANDLISVPKKREYQVQVIGAVGRPGSYALADNMTIPSLLAQVGNPTNNVGLGRAYVLRDGVQIPVDLRSILQGKLDERLAGFHLQKNDILVVPDVHEQVLVNGEVGKPGFYDLPDDLTITSLLAKAGNTTGDAALSQAYVLRGTTKVPLDLRSLASGQADPAVTGFKFQVGDTLIIPQNKLRYAVLGQAGRPGVYPYPEGKTGVTVLEALINAGGPGGGSALSKAGIIRQTNNQQIVVIPVNIDALLKNGSAADNMVLQPRDVLYIPPRGGGGLISKFAQALPFVGLFGGL